MRSKVLASLAAAITVGFFAAFIPVHVSNTGLSFSYTPSHADGTEKKKVEKEKKPEAAKTKSCTKDKPCNDANANKQAKEKGKTDKGEKVKADKGEKAKTDKGEKVKADKDKKDKVEKDKKKPS